MLIIFVEINFSKTILRKWALTLPLHLFSCLILSIIYLSRATIFADSYKRTLWEGVGVGGGCHILLVNFLCMMEDH